MQNQNSSSPRGILDPLKGPFPMPVVADMGMQAFLRNVVPFSYYNISTLSCWVEAYNFWALQVAFNQEVTDLPSSTDVSLSEGPLHFFASSLNLLPSFARSSNFK